MFQTVGRYRDPEWALRQVLAVITIILGLSCACSGLTLWMGVRLVVYLIGLLLGLILPAPPPAFVLAPEVELVEIELEDPTDVEVEEEAPDYQEWLDERAAMEAAESLASLDEDLVLMRVATTDEIMADSGVLMLISSSTAGLDLALTETEVAELGVLVELGGGSSGLGAVDTGGGKVSTGLSLGSLEDRGRSGYLRIASNTSPDLDHLPTPKLPRGQAKAPQTYCDVRVLVDERGRAPGAPTWVSCPEALRDEATKALRKARWSWPGEPMSKEVSLTVWFEPRG